MIDFFMFFRIADADNNGKQLFLSIYLSRSFHGQHSSDPNYDRRKENTNNIGRKSPFLFHFKDIASNTTRIHTGTRNGEHNEENKPYKTVFFYFVP